MSDRFRKFSSSDLIKSKQFLQTILPIKLLRYEACSLQTSQRLTFSICHIDFITYIQGFNYFIKSCLISVYKLFQVLNGSLRLFYCNYCFIWNTFSGLIFNITLFSVGDLPGYFSAPIYFFANLSMCFSASSPVICSITFPLIVTISYGLL